MSGDAFGSSFDSSETDALSYNGSNSSSWSLGSLEEMEPAGVGGKVSCAFGARFGEEGDEEAAEHVIGLG